MARTSAYPRSGRDVADAHAEYCRWLRDAHRAPSVIADAKPGDGVSCVVRHRWRCQAAAERAYLERDEWLRNAHRRRPAMIEAAQRKVGNTGAGCRGRESTGSIRQGPARGAGSQVSSMVNARADEAAVAKAAAEHEQAQDLQQQRYRLAGCRATVCAVASMAPRTAESRGSKPCPHPPSPSTGAVASSSATRAPDRQVGRLSIISDG